MDHALSLSAICDELATIPDVAYITRGWPKKETKLPCIVLQKSGESGAGFVNDAEYITLLECMIRVFATDALQGEVIALQVQQKMKQLGFARLFAWENSDQDAYQQAMRFSIVY